MITVTNVRRPQSAHGVETSLQKSRSHPTSAKKPEIKVVILSCFHLPKGDAIYLGFGKPLSRSENKGFTLPGSRAVRLVALNMIMK